MSRAYYSSPGQADEVVQRFRRFSELEPHNAQALYYYAMSLWKGKRAEDPTLDLHQIEMLLRNSIELDPKLADAHLQLANLYSDQRKYDEAIPEYVRALDLESRISLTRTTAWGRLTYVPAERTPPRSNFRSIKK